MPAQFIKLFDDSWGVLVTSPICPKEGSSVIVTRGDGAKTTSTIEEVLGSENGKHTCRVVKEMPVKHSPAIMSAGRKYGGDSFYCRECDNWVRPFSNCPDSDETHGAA